MSNVTNINRYEVTAAEIASAERVIDCRTNQAFYIIPSSRYEETHEEYHVKTILVNGKHHITCNCPAGLRGVPCRHKRIAIAAARIEKSARNEQTQESPKYVTNVDAETLARIEKANATAKVDRKAKAPVRKPFSLMR